MEGGFEVVSVSEDSSQRGDIIQALFNDLGCTSADSVRTAIGDNEPCPQEDLDSACHTEAARRCQRPQVGTRWEEAVGAEEVHQAHQQPVAFARKREPRLAHQPRVDAAGRRLGVVHRRPCAPLRPPSSLPSTLCGFL